MEKEHISTVLLLSVLLTFMCPVLGIIPLYHSIEAWKKNRKSDVSYVISLKKAYSWTKRNFYCFADNMDCCSNTFFRRILF